MSEEESESEVSESEELSMTGLETLSFLDPKPKI